MIRYTIRTPGGDGYIACLIRVWWVLVHSFHTFKFLIKQAFESHRRYNYRSKLLLKIIDNFLTIWWWLVFRKLF